uniref:NADH dehydrogenase subunit 4L n=1 Tax=Chaetocnema confinis TaxID=1896592 RepID=UPI00223826A9|nr:NADH dehydrogenase subunit 4L [Chaetocnema confinis]UYC28916.1 NADH dehydrogenase subunit 4L [Chaetocnema confinis]
MLMYLSFIFFMGSLSFIFNRKHLLLMLLSLEFIVVSLYMNMYMYISMFNYEFFFLMFFLIMSVCEGVLGISLMILMVRVHGNDYILSFSSLW